MKLNWHSVHWFWINLDNKGPFVSDQRPGANYIFNFKRSNLWNKPRSTTTSIISSNSLFTKENIFKFQNFFSNRLFGFVEYENAAHTSITSFEHWSHVTSMIPRCVLSWKKSPLSLAKDPAIQHRHSTLDKNSVPGQLSMRQCLEPSDIGWLRMRRPWDCLTN